MWGTFVRYSSVARSPTEFKLTPLCLPSDKDRVLESSPTPPPLKKEEYTAMAATEE